MKKFLGFILLLIILLVGILFAGRNQIVKFGIEKGTKKALNLDVIVGDVDINFKDTLVSVNNLKIMNPQGYGDSLMFDMPEMKINYHLKDMIGGKIHFEELRLNIAELVAVRNKAGDLNLSVFKPEPSNSQTSTSPASTGSSEKKDVSEKPLDLQIDSATIKLGKLVFKDYTKGDTPEVKQVEMNMDETFENVTDVQSIITTIIQKALMKSAFPGMDAQFGAFMDGMPKEAQGILNKIKSKIKIPSF